MESKLATAGHKYGYKTHHYRLYRRLSICLAAPSDTVCHVELYIGTLCLGDTVFPQREPNKINYTLHAAGHKVRENI